MFSGEHKSGVRWTEGDCPQRVTMAKMVYSGGGGVDPSGGGAGGGVCYVCGASGLHEEYPVRSSPGLSPLEPYYPFLETHEAPPSYRPGPPGSEPGVYRACYLCYTLLAQVTIHYYPLNTTMSLWPSLSPV